MTTIADLPPETTWNFGSVVQQVAAALDGASKGALFFSVPELLTGYRHVPEEDFSRLRKVVPELRNALGSVVLQWMAVQAIAEFGDAVDSDGTGYRLRDGIRLADLRWRGRAINPPNRSDPHRRLGDRFNTKATHGTWVVNIRTSKESDEALRASELYESMVENGWVDDPMFNALVDEHGVVLVGHRRLRVAEMLGIEPHIRLVPCGRGDEGDIKRLALAVLSNWGHKVMTPTDRRKIIAVLLGEDHDWTQMSLAKALGVSRSQIQKDIAALRNQGFGLPPGGSRNDSSESDTEPPSPPPKNSPQLHALIDQLWDEGGERPTLRDIVDAAHVAGMDIGQTTAHVARNIVTDRRQTAVDTVAATKSSPSPPSESVKAEPASDVPTYRCTKPGCDHHH